MHQSEAFDLIKKNEEFFNQKIFLIYINDLVTDIYCKIKLFADDPSVIIKVENALVSGDLLNNDLEIINTWSKNGLFLLTRQKRNV